MANVIAQHPTRAFYANASTVTKAFASGATNPSLIVAIFTGERTTGSWTASDGTHGSYTQDITVQNASGNVGAGTSNIFSVQNTSTATLTITGTPPGADYGILDIYEVTGAATSSALDSTGGAYNQTGAAISVSITTLTADCSVFLCGTSYSGPTGSIIDSGFTESGTPIEGDSSYHFSEYNADAGAATTLTLNFTGNGGTASWGVATAAYKTSGGGGGGVAPIVPQLIIFGSWIAAFFTSVIHHL